MIAAAASIINTTALLAGFAATVHKTMGSITGLDLSIRGVLTTQAELGNQLLNLSRSAGSLGGGISVLTDRIFKLSKSTDFSASSLISMQKTLMVGFNKPIADVDTFSALLAKSENLFGKNEAAAQKFIEQLGELSMSNRGLRNDMIELMVLQGRQLQNTNKLSASEMTRATLLKAANASQLAMMLLFGEISAEQYNQNLSLMAKSEPDEQQLNVPTGILQANQAARNTTIKAQYETLKTPGVATTFAVANNLGSDAVVTAADTLASSIAYFRTVNTSIMGDSIAVTAAAAVAAKAAEKATTPEEAKILVEAALKKADATAEDTAALMASQKIQDEINKSVIANGAKAIAVKREQIILIGKFTEAELKAQQVARALTAETIIARDNMASLSASAQKINLANTQIGQYKALSGKGSMSNDMSGRMEVSTAQIADNEIQLRGARQLLALFEADRKKKLDQASAVQANPAVVEAERRVSLSVQQGYIARIAELEGQRMEILNQTAGRLDSINAYYDKQLELKVSANAVTRSEIELLDNLAVGIGASAAMREKSAREILDQVDTLNQEIVALKTQQAQFSPDMVGEKAVAEQKINDIVAKRNQLSKQALDQLQQLREGYLDAIGHMQSGAGIFTEILVSQDQSLGSLIRTTAEVPRALKTGAGSGGITQATQFGPGGIVGGFNPQSEEYGKNVLSSFDDINKLVSALPSQLASAVGGKPALGAQAQNADAVLFGSGGTGISSTSTLAGTGQPSQAERDEEGEKIRIGLQKIAKMRAEDDATRTGATGTVAPGSTVAGPTGGTLLHGLDASTPELDSLNEKYNQIDIAAQKEFSSSQAVEAKRNADAVAKIKNQEFVDAPQGSRFGLTRIVSSQDTNRELEQEKINHLAKLEAIQESYYDRDDAIGDQYWAERKKLIIDKNDLVPNGSQPGAQQPTSPVVVSAVTDRPVDIPNLKEMTDQISSIIQKGVVEAVTIGMTKAIAELSRT